MKALAADLDLAFQPGEVVLCIVQKLFLTPRNDEPFDGLGQQKLVMEGHIRTSVLQAKNNPDSQAKNR